MLHFISPNADKGKQGEKHEWENKNIQEKQEKKKGRERK